jgi:hypothetical protein
MVSPKVKRTLFILPLKNIVEKKSVNVSHQDMLYWWISKFTPLGMEVFIL